MLFRNSFLFNCSQDGDNDATVVPRDLVGQLPMVSSHDTPRLEADSF